MSRCSCESRCNCLLEAGENILVDFDSDTYTISSSVSRIAPDYLTLHIDGIAANVAGANLSVETTGYTIGIEGEKKGGSETVNLNLYNVAPSGGINFSIDLGQWTSTYVMQVRIWASSESCTDKMLAERAGFWIKEPSDAFAPMDFGTEDNWTANEIGGDLTFSISLDGTVATITSTSGGCYMAQMTVQWLDL